MYLRGSQTGRCFYSTIEHERNTRFYSEREGHFRKRFASSLSPSSLLSSLFSRLVCSHRSTLSPCILPLSPSFPSHTQQHAPRPELSFLLSVEWLNSGHSSLTTVDSSNYEVNAKSDGHSTHQTRNLGENSRRGEDEIWSIESCFKPAFSFTFITLWSSVGRC